MNKLELEEIRKKIIEHIEMEQLQDRYEGENAQELIASLKEMEDSQFIEFLKKNNLIKDSNQTNENCIFCSMISEEIPTTKIGENEKAIAILELNPVSEGHTLIIPKEHVSDPDKIETIVQDLAKEIKEKIDSVLSPKEIKIFIRPVMGHEAINLVPVYNNETIDSKRTKKTPEELEKLQEKILSFKSIKSQEPKEINVKKEIKQISDKDIILPKRIP